VDWESNHQIPNMKLNKVPLIRELVNTFAELFPYLLIDTVWLLHKKKSGDSFQGRHKDLALGSKITKTIVVNLALACIIKSHKGKEEQELKAIGEFSCKEYTMDICEIKQKSHQENAIAMVFNRVIPEIHECSLHVFLELHSVFPELHG
jgi:hypothetical protein